MGLEQIWDYTKQRWGDDQAERCTRELQLAIQLVADKPLIGRPCDDVRAAYRKHAVGFHTLYYRVAAGGLIDVVRILHKRMDVDEHLD